MELSAAYTSSHQFSVDVTGLQYPSLEGGYGICGREDHRDMMDEGRLLRRDEGVDDVSGGRQQSDRVTGRRA